MDNENENTNYLFTVGFRIGGVIESDVDYEETLSRLREEFDNIYGEDRYELIDFHEITEEEATNLTAMNVPTATTIQ